MRKSIENINSLTAYFCLYDIDIDEEPIVRTTNFLEFIKALTDYRLRYGLNWDANLLFSIEDETGDDVMHMDVAKIELFI